MAWRFLDKINFIDRGLVNAVKCSANALDGWNGSDEVYNITHSDILQLGDFKVGRNIGNESYGLHGAHDTWMHFYNESNNWYYRALVIYKNGSDVVHYTQITQSYDDDFYYGIAVNDDISRAALIQVRVNRNSGSIVDATAWFYASGTFTFEDFYNAFRCGDQYYSSRGAGAGSGYIGNSLLSNKKMVGYNVPTSSAEATKTESVNVFDSNYVADKPKAGNGHARIKFLSDTYTDGKIIAITTKTPSAWVSVSTEDNDAYVCIANLNGTELQAIKVSDGITIFNKLEPTTDRTSYLIQFDNLTEGQTYKFYLKKGNARTLSIQRQVITRTILFSHSDLITFANNHSSKFVFGKQSPTYSGEFISFTINNNYLTWNGQCDSYTNTDIGAGSNRLAISVPNDATRMAMLVTFKRIDSANLHNVSVINHIQVCNSSYRRLAYVYYKTLIEKDNEIILVAMIDFDNLDIVRSNIAYICIRMDNTDNDFTNTVYNIQMSGLQVWAE